MTEGKITALRRAYHRDLFETLLRLDDDGYPDNADRDSKASRQLAIGIVEQIGLPAKSGSLGGQRKGRLFEEATLKFVRDAFATLRHVRPGEWEFRDNLKIQAFAQYRHLAEIGQLTEKYPELRVTFGDYIVAPDIVVFRDPLSDETLNREQALVGDAGVVDHSPLRKANSDLPILHASVSCKWTIRSDRSQNARTEGLNLMRNRKGNAPHIVVVTGEPLPSRISSLALGTGDIDCVYHFALTELRNVAGGAHQDMLDTLVNGSRLRDISDLPFDLAT